MFLNITKITLLDVGVRKEHSFRTKLFLMYYFVQTSTYFVQLLEVQFMKFDGFISSVKGLV